MVKFARGNISTEIFLAVIFVTVFINFLLVASVFPSLDNLSEEDNKHLEILANEIGDEVTREYLLSGAEMNQNPFSGIAKKYVVNGLVNSVIIESEDNRIYFGHHGKGDMEMQLPISEVSGLSVSVGVTSNVSVFKEQLFLIIVGLGLFQVAMLMALRKWMRGRLQKPINEIKQALNYYKSGEFKKSRNEFVIAKSGTEIDVLSDALDAVYHHEINQLELEESLRRDIEKESTEKNTFIANMAHDYRTPLVTIDLMLRELCIANSNPNDAAKSVDEYIRALFSQVGEMELMVNNTLEVARFLAGQEIRLNAEKTDLFRMLLSTTEAFRYDTNHKGLFLNVNAQGLTSVVAQIDVSKFKQVYRNLISNAVKYTESGGIIVSAWLGEKAIMVSVKDTGKGISKEAQDKVFEPFNRTTDSEKITGTGVGLSSSLFTLKKVGGAIEIKNTTNKGTEFIFSFPLDDMADLSNDIKGGDKTILVSLNNDETGGRSHVTGLLKEHGNSEVVSLSELDKLNEMDPNVFALVLHDVFVKDENGRVKFSGLLDVDARKAIARQAKNVASNNGKVVCVGSEAIDVKSIPILNVTSSLCYYDLPVIFYQSDSGEVDFHSYSSDITMKSKRGEISLLLVDDTTTYAELMGDVLIREGFTNISFASNGLDAVKKYKKHGYNVVLMDHMMPVMGGIEATKIIKDYDPDAFIIGFTAAKQELGDGIAQMENLMNRVYVKRFDCVPSVVKYIDFHTKGIKE